LGRAIELYLRAVAVDPDCYDAWNALARLRTSAGDLAGALEAERASLGAWERTAARTADPSAHAARIYALAQACRAAGDEDSAGRLSLRAHRIAPSFAGAAVAVADRLLQA